MTDSRDASTQGAKEKAPGEKAQGNDGDITKGATSYVIGLVLAMLMTAASFAVANGWAFVWQPGIGAALIALAVGQIGVHLVFFLHLTTGSDNTNNALALAFGTLVVILIVGGSLWIMHNLDQKMMPTMPTMP
ncbi:cytochrome o ubiquinol oxidase subunit IV [Rhizobium sp. AN80A]|uniref:cytochrome o ubiquinol oxidase subunit IV n=1 Tax=Rhizobium sp. AN80A TaxID=3040673 RepID=UPI000DBA62F2|nr:cytochrome o ubiquinol oxidase subunit IV [Rhizobium sp. AN80A]